MGDRFADFDALLAEQRGGRSKARLSEPLVIRLFGETWNLGYGVPARAALLMGRLAADGDIQQVNLGDPKVVGRMLELAEAAIPRPVMEAWEAHGIDIDTLGQVVLWMFGHWFAGGDGEGEAAAPEAGAPSTSSSNDGVSSTPTSDATTASTSAGTSAG